MAVNFRLAYNTGVDYTDLLPRTSMKNIEGNENVLSYSEVKLTIPAFDGLTQKIENPLTPSQAVAPFTVDLISKGPDALRAYYTIDQIEADATGFTITRLSAKAEADIDVLIRFKERGVNGN